MLLVEVFERIDFLVLVFLFGKCFQFYLSGTLKFLSVQATRLDGRAKRLRAENIYQQIVKE